jgi:hypothetical protein
MCGPLQLALAAAPEFQGLIDSGGFADYNLG